VFESWTITRSRGACSACDREFAPKRTFFSCLEEQKDDFVRIDFCPGCWETQAPERFFCFWRSRRAEPNKRPTLDTELMLEFFDRLARPDNDRKRTFRFVLALYLMRRKELKLLRVERDGEREVLVFQRRSSGEELCVANPDMTEDQIQETSRHLGQLLTAEM